MDTLAKGLNKKIKKFEESDDIVMKLGLNQKEIQKLIELENLSKIEWYSELITLKDGNCFGQQALTCDDASIFNVRSKSECTLAVINKLRFRKVLHSIEKRHITQ